MVSSEGPLVKHAAEDLVDFAVSHWLGETNSGGDLVYDELVRDIMVDGEKFVCHINFQEARIVEFKDGCYSTAPEKEWKFPGRILLTSSRLIIINLTPGGYSDAIATSPEGEYMTELHLHTHLSARVSAFGIPLASFMPGFEFAISKNRMFMSTLKRGMGCTRCCDTCCCDTCFCGCLTPACKCYRPWEVVFANLSSEDVNVVYSRSVVELPLLLAPWGQRCKLVVVVPENDPVTKAPLPKNDIPRFLSKFQAVATKAGAKLAVAPTQSAAMDRV